MTHPSVFTPAQVLLDELRRQPLSLQALHERTPAAGLDWSAAQLRLFLRCLPDVAHDEATGLWRTASGGGDPLQEAIVAAARSFSGKPVTVAQLRARLPSDFITTNEQVLAVARRTARLQIVGPGLIRSGA